MNCNIRVFRAINDTESCKKFKEGHRNVLKEYQIQSNALTGNDWMKNPNVYCIVAESPDENKLIGGVRIQVADGHAILPAELAIGKKHKMMMAVIDKQKEEGGMAEIDALWHSKKVAGNSISTLLLRAAVALCKQLKIRTLIALCADYSLARFYQLGFREFESLAGQSNFPFPTELYSAKLLAHVDPDVLKHADVGDRERIHSLRNYPNQNFIEYEEELGIKINYELLIAV